MGKSQPTTVGGRVRVLRVSLGLSQSEVAAAFPGKRTQAWISSVETGRQELAREDAAPLAALLHTTEVHLLTGDQADDSSFIARMRGLEPLLDERAQRAVIGLAEQQAAERRAREENDAFSLIAHQMLRAGIPPEQTRRVVAAARATAAASAQDGEQAAEPPGREAAQG